MGTTGTILATIGYENADLSDFIASLHAASVTCLVDVRELAISRRRGFSKSALSAALEADGIDYVHLRGLGDPKEGREAARRGDHARFVGVFTRHMKTPVAQTDLVRAASLVARGGACLMCYERDHTSCHRSIVATAISATIPTTIRHIGVSAGIAARSITTTARDLAPEWT
jgi:uncharacterized protein (DUF488 family)